MEILNLYPLFAINGIDANSFELKFYSLKILRFRLIVC